MNDNKKNHLSVCGLHFSFCTITTTLLSHPDRKHSHMFILNNQDLIYNKLLYTSYAQYNKSGKKIDRKEWQHFHTPLAPSETSFISIYARSEKLQLVFLSLIEIFLLARVHNPFPLSIFMRHTELLYIKYKHTQFKIPIISHTKCTIINVCDLHIVYYSLQMLMFLTKEGKKKTKKQATEKKHYKQQML